MTTGPFIVFLLVYTPACLFAGFIFGMCYMSSYAEENHPWPEDREFKDDE